MGIHIIDGEFQSDKYPACPRGKVPLSVKDPTAQDLLWEYAQRRRAVDPEFSDDLEVALRVQGYVAPTESDVDQLRRVCAWQSDQIADLQAALTVTDRPRAIPPRHRWRAEPPTPDEVTKRQWWWNRSPGGVPHILQLDRNPGSGLIFDAGDSPSCPPPFDPSDWPGEWAPCMTPDEVTARVSRIADASKRLVMSHVAKAKALRAQLDLETAALEQACSAEASTPLTVAKARALAVTELSEDQGGARP